MGGASTFGIQVSGIETKMPFLLGVALGVDKSDNFSIRNHISNTNVLKS